MRDRKAGRPVWWLVGGGLVVLAIVVVAVLALSGAGATYDVATPAVAGGLELDSSTAKRISPEELRKTEAQLVVGGKATRGVGGTYLDRANNNLQVTFTGVAGNLGDPADLLARLRANPPQVLKSFEGTVAWTEVDPGPHGGKAACGQVNAQVSGQPLSIITCSWQTETTFGQLTELPRAGARQVLSASDMADLMRRMRPDLEPTG